MKSLIAALALTANLIAALPARAQFRSLNSEVPIPFDTIHAYLFSRDAARDTARYTVRNRPARRPVTPPVASGVPRTTQGQLDLAGYHLQRSARMSTAALATGAVSGTVFAVTAARGGEWKTARVYGYTIGAILAATSLYCTASAIVHKSRAGSALRLTAAPSGLSLSYQF